MTKAKVSGRKFFQMRCMSWSYRNRGYEAWTHRKRTERRAALVIMAAVVNRGIMRMRVVPRNRTAERVFIRRIFAYSAKKKSAKGPPAYSTLKPETSSDSPSVRSKGARFVSASVEMYHITASGQAGRISQIFS